MIDVKTSKSGILTVMVAPSSMADTIDRSMLILWYLNESSHPYR